MRVTAHLTLLAMMASALAVPSAAQSAPPSPAPVDLAKVIEQPTVEAALDIARKAKRGIQISERRSPTEQWIAHPDGSIAVEQYATPQRARRADGSWGEIDTTLRADRDGSLRPVGVPVGVRFSGGGAGPLVTLTSNGRELSLSFSDKLPKPTVQGDTATYANVLADVDLRVRATRTGFQKVFVVKTRAAAADPRLKSLAFTTATKGLTLRLGEDGALSALDEAGRVVFSSASPHMWDSTPPTAADIAAGDSPRVAWGPSRDGRRARVATALAGNRLTLTPDQSLLSNPETVLPLYIDPSTGESLRSSWAFVNSLYPDEKYLNGANWPDGGDGLAMVGKDPSRNQIFRSFFQFDIGWLADKTIFEASFVVQMTHTAYRVCWETGNPYRISHTGGIDGYTSWNNQPAWGTVQADRTEARGNANGPCPNPEDMWTDIRGLAQAHADASAGTLTLGMHAHNEGDDHGWRRFNENSGRIYARFGHRPNPASGLDTVPSSVCKDGGRALLGIGDQKFTAQFSDPDGDNLTARLRFDVGSSVGTPFETTVASGNAATWTVPSGSLAHGTVYSVWAYASDGYKDGYADSCQVEVDQIRPNPPVIKRTDTRYPTVGKTLGFTFTTSDSDVEGFYYGLSDPPGTYVPAVSGTASVLITPVADGLKELRVKAVDRAKNESVIGSNDTFRFSVNPGTAPIGHWKLDGSGADTAYPSNPDDRSFAVIARDGASYGGSPAEANEGHGGYLQLNGSTAYAATDAPVLDSLQSFTVAAWARRANNNSSAVLLGQTGVMNSAFYLIYDPPTKKWNFCMLERDTSAPGGVCAESAEISDLNVWTHVAGSYDPAVKKIFLYVNGTRTEKAVSTVFAAGNEFTIGRGKWLGYDVNYFPGSIDDVRAYDRVVTSGEIKAMAKRLEGRWSFEDAVNTSHTDGSGRGRSLDVDGFVKATNGFHGQGISWPSQNIGGDSWASSFARTDASYTVSAWVRLTHDDATATAVSQNGDSNFAYALGYDKPSNRWSFAVTSANTATAQEAKTTSSAPPKLGVWTHLTGVFDADSRRIHLWVDGVLHDSRDSGPVWHGSTYFEIGCAYFGGYKRKWAGDIDEVSLTAGVLDPQEILVLATRDGRVPNPPLPLPADVNADGKADTFVVQGSPDGKTRIQLYRSTGTGFAPPQQWWSTDAGTMPTGWQHDGSRWISGDFNGDGRTDLAAFVRNDGYNNDSTRWVRNTRLWVFFTDPSGDGFVDTDPDDPEGLVPDLMTWGGQADLGWPLDYAKIDSGDVNGDGRSDIIATVSSSGSTGYRVLTLISNAAGRFDAPAERVITPAADRGDLRLIDQVVADFNGDGWADLAHYYRTAEGSAALSTYSSTTTGFETPIQTWVSEAWSLERTKNVIGNFDGDAAHRADIVQLYSTGIPNYHLEVFAGAGAPARWLSNAAPANWGRMTPFAGDFNGDGKTDYAYLDYIDPRNPQVTLHIADSTGTGFAAWRQVV